MLIRPSPQEKGPAGPFSCGESADKSASSVYRGGVPPRAPLSHFVPSGLVTDCWRRLWYGLKRELAASTMGKRKKGWLTDANKLSYADFGFVSFSAKITRLCQLTNNYLVTPRIVVQISIQPSVSHTSSSVFCPLYSLLYSPLSVIS